MKKFGTPILAAPGSASVYEGSFSAGVAVSASSLSASRRRRLRRLLGALLDLAGQRLRVRVRRPWPCCVVVLGRLLGLLLGLAGLLLGRPVLPESPFWFSGVGVAVGVALGVAVTVGACVAVGVGVVSVEPRSTIDETAARQTGYLDLVDRRARRDLDRDRQLLPGHQCHAHVVHLSVRGGHEHARVERGCGERDGKWTAGRIHGPERRNLAALYGVLTRTTQNCHDSCAVLLQLPADWLTLDLCLR